MRRETIRVTVEKEVDVTTLDLEPEQVAAILAEHTRARLELQSRTMVKTDVQERMSGGEYMGHTVEFYLEPIEGETT
ncbi:hypothetical protein [Aquibium oceanicum]|uniref:Uncharacterized protein n=1 Tax=Aquibium oceanicum TaxID=1670800 RepID=A0A1L3SXV2_9HYPH|nr:hypothetical protein [Aquibium oceanicum]APH74135.1 hypothetical protein BSQ44_24260 [Aquibium oceanicum]